MSESDIQERPSLRMRRPGVHPAYHYAHVDYIAWTQPQIRNHAARRSRDRGRALIVETPLEHLARLRRLMRDSVSLDAAWAELNDYRNRPTPRATIEAVMHAVRERGLAALKEPVTAERLQRCDEAAKAEIERRIANL